MTKLSQIREEFIEASCPDSASQAQIQNMGMAFDAGAVALLNIILNMPKEEFNENMDKLAKELIIAAEFHGGE